MTKLLTKAFFDSFLVSEAQVTTFTTFSVDGTWHPDFFLPPQERARAEEERQTPPQETAGLTWKLIRPLFYELIRGRNTPLSFHIVLKLSPSNVERLLQSGGISQVRPEQIDGLFLNFTYQNDTVTCVTGSSLKVFTLDKTLEHTWDDMALHFFSAWKIGCESV